MKALSIRQPWVDAILHHGKRIENRTQWRNCSHRGPLYLHAAKAMTMDDWGEASMFAKSRKLAWQPPPMHSSALVFGAIVGRCNVVDVIFPGGVRRSPAGAILGPHPLAGDPWYMGGFALVLDNVHAFAVPAYCPGSLSLFTVSDDVLAVLPP